MLNVDLLLVRLGMLVPPCLLPSGHAVIGHDAEPAKIAHPPGREPQSLSLKKGYGTSAAASSAAGDADDGDEDSSSSSSSFSAPSGSNQYTPHFDLPAWLLPAERNKLEQVNACINVSRAFMQDSCRYGVLPHDGMLMVASPGRRSVSVLKSTATAATTTAVSGSASVPSSAPEADSSTMSVEESRAATSNTLLLPLQLPTTPTQAAYAICHSSPAQVGSAALLMSPISAQPDDISAMHALLSEFVLLPDITRPFNWLSAAERKSMHSRRQRLMAQLIILMSPDTLDRALRQQMKQMQTQLAQQTQLLQQQYQVATQQALAQGLSAPPIPTLLTEAGQQMASQAVKWTQFQRRKFNALVGTMQTWLARTEKLAAIKGAPTAARAQAERMTASAAASVTAVQQPTLFANGDEEERALLASVMQAAAQTAAAARINAMRLHPTTANRSVVTGASTVFADPPTMMIMSRTICTNLLQSVSLVTVFSPFCLC